MSWSERWRALTAEARKQSAAVLTQSIPSHGQVGRLLRKLADEQPRSGGAPGPRVERPRSQPRPTQAGADRHAMRRTPSAETAGGLRVLDTAPTARVETGEPSMPQDVVSGAFAALAAEPPASAGRTPVPEIAVGDVLAGRYEIRRVVGAGEAFQVYAARHVEWGINVAIKTPRPGAHAGAGPRDSLAARALRWIGLGAHPCVVSCYYLDRCDGRPFLVLEYREDGNLRSWIDAGHVADLQTRVNLAVQICHGLEEAHAAKLWHGGLRPENLLFGADGTLAIGDFGLSTLTACPVETSGDVIATAAGQAYVAPELWGKESAISVRSDLFALGVCLYELFTGATPYARTSGSRSDPREPDAQGNPLPPPLAALLRRCVEWEAARRPSAVAEVREELCALHHELFGRPSPFAQLPDGSWEADGWNNQAVALALLGHDTEADAAWERALSVDPGHLDAAYNAAMARWRRREISDKSVLERVTQAAGRRRDAQAATLLAAVHLDRGDAEAALAQLDSIATAGGLDDEGERVLAAARRGRDVSAGLVQAWSGHRGHVRAVQITGDAHVLSAGDDGLLGLWAPGQPVALRSLIGHERAVSALCASADGRIAISGSDDTTLRVWDLQGGQCLKVIGTPGKVFCVAASADATRALVACSGSDNFVGVDGTKLLAWDLERDRPLGELEGHTNATKSVALSADGRLAVSGSDDQTVRVWDLDHGGGCRRVLTGHEHYVSAVCISADGAVAASGSWDKTVRVWDMQTGRCLRVLRDHEGIVNALALSRDGSLLVSGGWDRTVRVWDTGTGRCLRTFDAHDKIVSSVALSADGALAASGSWDMTVRLWRIPSRSETTFRPRLSRRARGPAMTGR